MHSPLNIPRTSTVSTQNKTKDFALQYWGFVLLLCKLHMVVWLCIDIFGGVGALYFIAVTCSGTEREECQFLVFSCPSVISTEHVWSHYLLSQVYHGQQLPGFQEAGKGEDESGMSSLV